MIPGGADEPKVWVLLDSYRGLQWGIDGWGGIPADQCMVVNSIFSVINTEIAQLNARHPVVDVLATDQGISRNARVQEIVVNHLIRSHRIRFKREVNRTLYNALLPGMGLLQHGYTPSIETFSKDGELIELYDPAKPDFPWVRSRLPWEYRLDCRAETFDPEPLAYSSRRSQGDDGVGQPAQPTAQDAGRPIAGLEEHGRSLAPVRQDGAQVVQPGALLQGPGATVGGLADRLAASAL
jgi:hypothetical protein